MKKIVIKELPKCTVELRIADTTYVEKGDSVKDALSKLRPDTIKTRGVLTVRVGERSSKQIFYPFQIKRLVANNMIQDIVAKRLTLALQ